MTPTLNVPKVRYNFFIAYPGVAAQQAEELYSLFEDSSKVYLDSRNRVEARNRTIDPPEEPQAASYITVALIHIESQSALFAQKEVSAGIAYELEWGEARHQVVPVYLNNSPVDPVQIPYSLRCKHALILVKKEDLKDVAIELHKRLQSMVPTVSLSSSLHPLKKYRTYPLVPREWVSEELIQSYAQSIRQSEALQVIAQANRFRRSADPDDPHVTTIQEYQLLSVYTVTPYAFWLHAFTEARMHGPRMLAALLLVVPADLFGVEARLNRRDLLEQYLIS